MFKETKLLLLKLISEKQIITTTKIQGVFILYVDHWEDDRILPMFVGSSTNIYSSFISKKRKIEKQLKYEKCEDEQKNVLYKRIADYLKKYNLTIDSIKGCILDQVENGQILEDQEDQWALLLKASIYGFNRSRYIHYLRKLKVKIEVLKYDPSSTLLKKYLVKVYKNGLLIIDQINDYSKPELLKGYFLRNLEEIYYDDSLKRIEEFITTDEDISFYKDSFNCFKRKNSIKFHNEASPIDYDEWLIYGKNKKED